MVQRRGEPLLWRAARPSASMTPRASLSPEPPFEGEPERGESLTGLEAARASDETLFLGLGRRFLVSLRCARASSSRLCTDRHGDFSWVRYRPDGRERW